ncbi:hypothetical protein ABVT39_014643 [Epinephelus coioides]
MRICLMRTHQKLFNCCQADEVKVFKVKRNLDAGGFQQFIRAIYPELRNKVNRHRVVVPLTESTPKEIRSSGVLGRSALYVRPLCEIETDTDSSEPMDMDLASFPSASSRSSPPVSPQVSQELREVLCTLVGNLDIKALPPPANRMNFVRADILESAFRAFRREALDPERKLDVVFIDTCGQGEGSVDNGGPTREFLTLLTKALISSRFFVGPASSKNLGLDSIGGDAVLIQDGLEPVHITLEDVLMFATGADRIPPLGFSVVPSLAFLHEHSLRKRKFPEANTCALIMRLPMHASYEQFSDSMISGIKQSPQFGTA